MTQPFITAETIDDLMRKVFGAVLADGTRIAPRKGPALELSGVVLELRNPRARLSRTETRGKAFSCLGELCWYLSKTDRVEPISYYLPYYDAMADDGAVYGAYGPRLFDWSGVNQLENVVRQLKAYPESRRAAVQLFHAADLVVDRADIPCTCTLQFLQRDDKVHLMVFMRSNDVHWGFPHDVFSFTMLQEIVARSLSADLGWYRHVVGSLHLYEKHFSIAETFLEEGWQTTQMPMPPMPPVDPWPSICQLLEAEAAFRDGANEAPDVLQNMDPYWADLALLLGIFGSVRRKNAEAAKRLRDQVSSTCYLTSIAEKLDRLSSAGSVDGA
jgi:thymidylate synthase